MLGLIHEIQRRVYVEQTDQTGVLYHGRYIDFFQQGRTEWLRAHCDITLNQLKGSYLVRSIEIKYKKPLRLDQLFSVKTTLIEKEKFHFYFRQEIIVDNKPCTLATVKIIYVDEHDNLQMIDASF